LSTQEILDIFQNGMSFMNVDVIFPTTENTIPYDKNVLIFHGTIQYDMDGNQVHRNIKSSKRLSDALVLANANNQQSTGISGIHSIVFNDADTAKYLKKITTYNAKLQRIKNEFSLGDDDTIKNYKIAWWTRELQNSGIDWTSEELDGLVNRWALGIKTFSQKDIEDSEKRKYIRQFESDELPVMQKVANRPIESIFLRVGADILHRVINVLSTNNPQVAVKLKKELTNIISTVKLSHDDEQLDILHQEIEKLDDLGIGDTIPSEGMVILYKGQPYRYKGTFSPVKQILDVLKFPKGKLKKTAADNLIQPMDDTEQPMSETPEKMDQEIYQ
jgi:hypothetical protein